MRLLALLIALALAAPAHAQPASEESEICADRPGLASSTCIVERNKVQVELAIDWSFQEEGDERTDTFLAGDTVVRVGVDEKTEVQFGWTAFGSVRERSAGIVSTDASVGDAFVGIRRSLFDRGGVGVALQGRFFLPIGGSAVGAGDWGAELLAPLTFEVGGLDLALTPSIAAAPDADRRGRHLAYGLAVGLGFDLSERLSVVMDLALTRDHDPLGTTNEAVAAFALAFLAANDLQLDAGAVIGLNRDAADLELYIGAAKRF
jgi:hypothetical protein